MARRAGLTDKEKGVGERILRAYQEWRRGAGGETETESRRRFAKLLGVTEGTVHWWFAKDPKRRPLPSLGVLMRLAECLEVSTDVLLFGATTTRVADSEIRTRIVETLRGWRPQADPIVVDRVVPLGGVADEAARTYLSELDRQLLPGLTRKAVAEAQARLRLGRKKERLLAAKFLEPVLLLGIDAIEKQQKSGKSR